MSDHRSPSPIIRTTSASSSNSTSSSNYEKYLKLATESNPAMILELDLDGRIKYVSKLWQAITRSDVPKVGSSISDIILGTGQDKLVFHNAIGLLLANEEASYTVTFNITVPDEEDSQMTLEACGILIHNNITGLASHSMWIVKPFDPELHADGLDSMLPPEFIKILGFGATVFAEYLKSLQADLVLDWSYLPDPKLELCRVCETFIPDWWLETHSQSCVCEHRLEEMLQLLNDNLVEHLTLLKQENVKLQVYKGLPIIDLDEGILESLIELCDLAIDINSSEIAAAAVTSDTGNAVVENRAGDGFANPTSLNYLLSSLNSTFSYDFSPETKAGMDDIEAWKTKFKSTFQPQKDTVSPGLELLINDTRELAQEKVDTILRLNNAMKYSLRIKNEVNGYVMQLIKEQIENNKILVARTMDANSISSISTNSANTPRSNSQPQPSSAVTLKTSESSSSTDNTKNISANSTMTLTGSMNYPSVQEPRNEFFTDNYLNADIIPIQSLDSRVSDEHNSEGRKDYFGGASITTSTARSRSITPRQRINEGDTKPRSVDKSDTSSGLVTPSILSSKLFDTSAHSNVFPKLRTSLTLTPRRGSPSLSAISHHSSKVSGSKVDFTNSPVNSPFSSARDFLTPEQESSSNFSNLPKQPLSPLLLPVSQLKSPHPSISDYDVIKPISRGAYGSVYLARKKITSEYVAIKVLKKSDMIAKNQVTNIKSERAIMMVQSEKPYVARLFASFQNKNNLFLVMEYLPGGDLAALIKMMGCLPNRWALQYISEVVAGVKDMHSNGIIHHDLKPDNLLIDKQGHIKLTDFGLSRAGLVRRHNAVPSSKPLSVSSASAHSHLQDPVLESKSMQSKQDQSDHSSILTVSTPEEERRSSVMSPKSSTESSSTIKKGGSQLSLSKLSRIRSSTPPPTNLHTSRSRASTVLSEALETRSLSDLALFHPNDTKHNKTFFGTPDYLAPETINGTGEDNTCDWWSVGCILFEFLLGFPPFHAKTPEAIFEKILAGKIEWPEFTSKEEEREFLVPEAKDLIQKLLVSDPKERLGANGAQEIMDHPYFKDVDWDHVYDEEASFVPTIDNPEDTDYFELRGAVLDDFSNVMNPDQVPSEEIPELMRSNISTSHNTFANEKSSSDYDISQHGPFSKLSVSSVLGATSTANSPNGKHIPSAIPPHMRERRFSKLSDNQIEFGSFNFRNLSALDKANKDAINRLKSEHLYEQSSVHRRASSASVVSSSSEDSSSKLRAGRSSLTGASVGPDVGTKGGFVSDNASIRSYSPDRSVYYERLSRKGSLDEKTASSYSPLNTGSLHFIDDSPTMQKFKSPISPPSVASTPCTAVNTSHTRMRTLSKSSVSQRTNSGDLSSDGNERLHAISKLNSLRYRRRSGRQSTAAGEFGYHMDVLLCEPIPIHRYRATKDLESLGCTVVSVGAGDELVSRATSGVKFDLIITALKLPKVDAVEIVKLLKYTSGENANTPIVAATNYYEEAANTNVFSDVFEKPVSIETLRKLLSKYTLQKSQKEDAIMSDTEAL